MCEWGRACEIGLETSCREYSDIAFRDCDVLRGASVVLDIQNGDCADVHDIVFEDIRAEFESFFTAEQFQRKEEDQYTKQDQYAGTALISISNPRFRSMYSFLDAMKEFTDIYDVDLTGVNVAAVRNILFKNIAVYYDEKIPQKEGKLNLRIYVSSQDLPSSIYENIVIDNITVNGKKITEDMLPIVTDCPEAISFK